MDKLWMDRLSLFWPYDKGASASGTRVTKEKETAREKPDSSLSRHCHKFKHHVYAKKSNAESTVSSSSDRRRDTHAHSWISHRFFLLNFLSRWGQRSRKIGSMRDCEISLCIIFVDLVWPINRFFDLWLQIGESFHCFTVYNSSLSLGTPRILLPPTLSRLMTIGGFVALTVW